MPVPDSEHSGGGAVHNLYGVLPYPQIRAGSAQKQGACVDNKIRGVQRGDGAVLFPVHEGIRIAGYARRYGVIRQMGDTCAVGGGEFLLPAVRICAHAAYRAVCQVVQKKDTPQKIRLPPSAVFLFWRKLLKNG